MQSQYSQNVFGEAAANTVQNVLIKNRAVRLKLELYVKNDFRFLRTNLNFKRDVCCSENQSLMDLNVNA